MLPWDSGQTTLRSLRAADVPEWAKSGFFAPLRFQIFQKAVQTPKLKTGRNAGLDATKVEIAAGFCFTATVKLCL